VGRAKGVTFSRAGRGARACDDLSQAIGKGLDSPWGLRAMKLSRTITYAIQAMLRLAEAEEGVPVPCSQLARDGKMPERFLLQVLRSLVNHGLLQSTRGVDGGYYLAKLPRQISLCDIVEAFDNPLEPKVPELNGESPLTRDKVLATLRHASRAARAELKKLTLAHLMQADDSRNRLKEAEAMRPRKLD
jgi:Rrf2 family protein